MKKRIDFCILTIVVGAALLTAGCLSSVNGSADGSEYDHSLEIGGLSLDNFPVNSSGVYADPSQFTPSPGTSDLDADADFDYEYDTGLSEVCEDFCDCYVEVMGTMTFSDCMTSMASSMSDDACQAGLDELCP
jgi:hypothetical protein